MNTRFFDSLSSSMENNGVSASINVLLIHPHKIFLEALTEALHAREGLKVTPMMNDSINGSPMVQNLPHDVVVMGMCRLEPNVVHDLQAVSTLCAHSGVVIFSDLDEAWQIRRVFEAGVRGCVSLSAGLSDLVCAIRSIFEGRMYMCAESLRHMLSAQNICINLEDDKSLGQRESQVLRLIADGYSSKEIARSLNITPGTVDVHRRNIMRKVGLHKVADLTRYAIRNQIVGL